MQCYDLKCIEKKDFKEMVRSRGNSKTANKNQENPIK
jgi:hypothetical protein